MKQGSPGEPGHTKSKSRLLIVIFTIAATLLVLSMVVVFRAGHIAILAQDRMNSQLEAVSELQEWLSTVKDAETGQRGYLLTGEESYLQPYTDALQKLKTDSVALENLVSAGQLSREDVARTAGLVQEKINELAETIRLRNEKDLAQALLVVRSDHGKITMDQIRMNIQALLKTARENYNEATQEADRISFWRSATFFIVTIVNLAFLTWAFQTIRRQEWLQFGRMQLGEKLSGDPQLHDLTAKALTFLAEYLGAQSGVLYVDDGGAFRRSAVYALPDPQKVPEKFSPGEGLPGQAVRDKRSFVVRALPEGYINVGSALGKSAPRQIIIAPIRVEESVNAVVELGFLDSVPGAALEFLDDISEPTSVALRSAQYRTRLQELLEETQRQSEELQSQSEELRVSNEELAEQGRALKESQVRLEQQQAELEQSNSQLEEQTQILEGQKDDLSRAKIELENQAAVVEQASRYKSDFLANMSHELRTPLNSSLILAKLLADNREGNLSAEQIKYAQTIQSAGNDLLTLINDILDLAKVEAGRLDLKPEAFLLPSLVESLNGLFDPVAEGKGLKLRMTLAPDAPQTLETDRKRLEQVLKNLLSNAIKFTEKGEVSLNISRKPGGIAFAVQDTGIGIAEQHQKIIFEPFRQADPATDRKYGGTGLGLSISRELVRLMGGTITVTSELGRGSVFIVVLPEVYKPAKFLTPKSAQDINPLRHEAAPASPPSAPQPALKHVPRVPDDRERLTADSRMILLVEDDALFAGILADLAHELDFQVLIAQSAEESLVLARQFQPSAIILDIGLPDNSGMFVLERLKGDSRTRHIPVHVVSGNDYSEPALAMGAVGYMLKPVKREQLVEAFHKLEFRLTQRLRRVLVVEDDKVQLDSLKRLLGSRDVETVGVRTAAECLENLKSSTFDCMVLDLSLPDASGFSLLETLSAEEAYSFPPVIIYTGRDLSADEEQRLRKYSKSIIIKGAKSPERLLDEVTLFLHQIVSSLPAEKQQMLEKARHRDAAFEDKCILIAEDDVRNIFALTSLLEPKGVRTRIARNGREALRELEAAGKDPSKRVDLVLMDIMMPEMNGLDAMRAIRKNSEWQRLPIIALTAKAMKNDQEQCIQAGANDYLAKPLDVDKLLSLIRVWMPR
ncbi:MAG TPA: response regulator [Verrucomicrobiae bacterium]|jgi:signal transduction histidine kinase/DNA-binding response OmpR family regulator/CHASE3 domain sensor protein|nr:response regulator [Verrucomicrobiae bacterium]